ncbi:MAG: hypothetical protein ACPW61_09250 [Methyloligella sp. ZOD6]
MAVFGLAVFGFATLTLALFFVAAGAFFAATFFGAADLATLPFTAAFLAVPAFLTVLAFAVLAFLAVFFAGLAGFDAFAATAGLAAGFDFALAAAAGRLAAGDLAVTVLPAPFSFDAVFDLALGALFRLGAAFEPVLCLAVRALAMIFCSVSCSPNSLQRHYKPLVTTYPQQPAQNDENQQLFMFY